METNDEIYVLENSPAGRDAVMSEFVRSGLAFRFVDFQSSRKFGSKAEAILHYDLSGFAKPLYDMTGTGYNFSYSPKTLAGRR